MAERDRAARGDRGAQREATRGARREAAGGDRGAAEAAAGGIRGPRGAAAGGGQVPGRAGNGGGRLEHGAAAGGGAPHPRRPADITLGNDNKKMWLDGNRNRDVHEQKVRCPSFLSQLVAKAMACKNLLFKSVIVLLDCSDRKPFPI